MKEEREPTEKPCILRTRINNTMVSFYTTQMPFSADITATPDYAKIGSYVTDSADIERGWVDLDKVDF